MIALIATCLPLWLGQDDVRSRARPPLSGPEELVASEDGRFLLHFTQQGSDAPSGGDADGDGAPDMVDQVLEGLAIGVTAYAERGYREALPDSGLGGGDAIDVYLIDLQGSNGFAYPVEPGTDDRGHSCYVEIDASLGGSPGEVVASVAAHELHHCVQYAYTDETHPWLYEATATFEQYRTILDDTLSFAAGVLWGARLSQPDRPIDDRGDRFEYAGFVFVKYWEDRGGSVPALWEALEAQPEWKEGLADGATAAFDLDWAELWLDHATWNGFACNRDDGQHYSDSIPCVVDTSVPVQALDGGASEVGFTHTNATDTAAYAEIPAGDERGLTVSCEAPGPDAAHGLAIVALDPDGVRLGEAAAVGGEGESLEVALPGPVDAAGRLLIVSTSTGEEPVDVACALSRTEVPEPEGCGCQSTPPSWMGAGALTFLILRRRPRRADSRSADR